MTKIFTRTHRLNCLWWVNFCLICFTKVRSQCTGNGLADCACNFISACQWDVSTKSFKTFSAPATSLRKFIPDLRSLAKATSQVAEICEPGKIGIIYDCGNRIPLASTITLTPDEYEFTYNSPRKPFKQSSQIAVAFQQQHTDYYQAKTREPCFEVNSGKYYIEHYWWRALTTKTLAPLSTPLSNECTRTKIGVNRGHLIAAQYGRTKIRAPKTYLFTNAVPQFSILNSGSWKNFEQRLILWARENCQKTPLHVIVGSIPSTHARNEPRYLGEAGFSNYEGASRRYSGKQPYRINVPAFLWTAACCYSSSFTASTGFSAPNQPGRSLVQSVRLSDLFPSVCTDDINLFPGKPSCNDDKNYIPI